MKKILLTLCALLVAVSGAWAEETTITYSTSTGSYTAKNAAGTWASAWKSTATDPYVTISTGANNIKVADGSIWSGASGCTYTITAQSGYLITGYTITGTAQTNAQTLTPSEGGSAVEFATSGTSTLTVSGISSSSTSFNQSTPNKGIAITSFTITVEKMVSATYTVHVLGTTSTDAGVTFNSTSYKNGGTFTTSPITESDLTAIAIDGETATVSLSATDIYVIYKPDLTDLYVTSTAPTTSTDALVEGNWYILTQVRNGESPAYDTGAGNQLKRAATTFTPSSLCSSQPAAADVDEYLIRFIKSGLGEAYNIQFATGNFWNGVYSNATTATSFLVYNATYSSGSTTENGWALNATTDGTTYGSKVDNNGAGNNLSYWGTGQTTTGTNNIWRIYPVTVEKLSSVNVTYHVMSAANNEVTSLAAASQAVGAAPTIPEAKANCTYEYYSDAACTSKLEAITSSTSDVYAVYTYTNPFAFETAASYANISKWYYLRIRPESGYNNYIKYDSGADPNVAMTTDGYTVGAEAQQWAFVGDTDPYTGTGLTIYNKTAGSSLILASNTPNGDGATGGNTHATMETTGTKTYEVWYVETSDKAENGFYLKTADNHYLNRRATTSLDFWTGGHDIGSTFTVVEVPDNYASQVESDIKPWYDAAGTGYFNLTATAKTALETAGYTAALTNCDLDTYNALKAIVDEASNYSFPATGNYRIKSSGSRNDTYSYIAYGQPEGKSAGLITVPIANAPTDMSTVIRFTNDGNNNYTFTVQGMKVQTQTAANVPFPCSTEGDAATFNFDLLSPGVVGIYNTASAQNSNVAGYLHESGWTVPGVVNWNANGSVASYWTVEAAETATIALTQAADKDSNTNTYATFCAPFNVTAMTGNGVKAYTVTRDGDYVVLGEGATTIAAGTPVMVVGNDDATSTTLTIGSDYAAAPTNTGILKGVYVSTEVDCTVATGTNYALGIDADRIGFYHVAEGFILGANRCYLTPDGAASIKGFAISHDTTDAISTISAKGDAQQIIDLSGRRVQQPVRGLYIMNGKKIVIK